MSDTTEQYPAPAGVNPAPAGVNHDDFILVYQEQYPVAAGVNPVAAGVNPATGGVNPAAAGVNPAAAGVNPVTCYTPFMNCVFDLDGWERVVFMIFMAISFLVALAFMIMKLVEEGEGKNKHE